jgi:D-glycero-D-manno-heptose 1,7-bisphosphate phosphatase
VFLDRDGVLNVLSRGDYVKSADELALLPGVGEAVRTLNALNLPVFVISNQQGVAKGLMSQDDLGQVDAALRAALAESGAHLDGSYYCPHGAAEACACRKPQAGLLLQAARDHDLDLARSFFVGDAETDAGAALSAGVGRFVLVLSGKFAPEASTGASAGAAYPADAFPIAPHFVAPDLPAAVRWIAGVMDCRIGVKYLAIGPKPARILRFVYDRRLYCEQITFKTRPTA